MFGLQQVVVDVVVVTAAAEGLVAERAFILNHLTPLHYCGQMFSLSNSTINK